MRSESGVQSYRNLKVLILGLGLNQGGEGAAKFFAKAGAEVRVTDLKSEKLLRTSLGELKNFKNIEYTLGKHSFDDILWADLVIRNPAIKDSNPYLEFAKSHDKKIETDFGIFLNYINQQNLIAITGTKGKSTTASLIYEAVKASSKKVLLAGNIGKSILDTIPYLNKDILVIVEISSFQLQALEGKKLTPHIAVITNIHPDHLNWHKDLNEYIQAKKQIATNQTEKDYLLLNAEDKTLKSNDFLQSIKSKVAYFGHKYLDEKFGDLPLKGKGNKDNYSAALAIYKLLGIDEKVTFGAFQNFQGAEFRMQLIGEFNGIKIINDSAATNPQATIEALRVYPNSILIAGGMNKGLNYSELADKIAENVKAVYFLKGDATDEILESLSSNHKSIIKGSYDNLEDTLLSIKQTLSSGDIILFSPGATSFNLFQNEFDRGRKFNQAVEKVFR